MQCICGFYSTPTLAPADRKCLMCAQKLRFDARDYLEHGVSGLVSSPRSGQIAMAVAVEQTIERKEVLVVEGPVGVGKSYAYLVPALLSGKRVVVSTAQKPLQSQLTDIDGPRLLKALQNQVPSASIAMLKGKSNYACKLHTDIAQDSYSFLDWLAKTETADFNEFTGTLPARHHEVTADGCLGTRCPFANDCGYRKSRQRALEANVVIVNHALVSFDLRFGPKKLFGDYSVLILDEAHKAAPSFRSAFEETLTSNGAIRILKALDAVEHLEPPVEGVELTSAWTDAFDQAKSADGAITPDPFKGAGLILEEALDELRSFADSQLRILSRAHAETADEFSGNPDLKLEDYAPLLKMSRATAKACDALKLIRAPSGNTLLTAERTSQGTHRFKATPISVGAMVGKQLAQIPSIVFTSATMTTNGSFADFRRDLGLNFLETPIEVPTAGSVATTVQPATRRVVNELCVPSPFNYRVQGAHMYVPKHLPPALAEHQATPASRVTYINALAAEIVRLVTVSKGNALVLFTATLDLQQTHERLKELAPSVPWIAQASDTGFGAEAVLRKYHATQGGVMLGLKSFWEGVSVEGDKLWLVIITKLPFPNPQDPLFQAQEAKLMRELAQGGVKDTDRKGIVFRTLTLPPMITDARQGAGRLIRTKTDRGILAILDNRVWTGRTGATVSQLQKNPQGYGQTVIEALGFSQNWTSDFAFVAQCFKRWLV